MDAKVSADELTVKLDKNPAAIEAKDIVLLSSSPAILDNGGWTLCPITPDSNKESMDLLSAVTSPFISSPPATGFYMVEDICNPSTPKEGVFDPFVPGPEKLMLAPHFLKYLEESRTYVARRLNFNPLVTKNDKEKPEHASKAAFEDDMVLEAVYDSLLEAIMSKQAEDILAEISAMGSNLDALKTPPSAPCLSGIAATCPGAPLKPANKSRNINLGLCRKLEFDF